MRHICGIQKEYMTKRKKGMIGGRTASCMTRKKRAVAPSPKSLSRHPGHTLTLQYRTVLEELDEPLYRTLRRVVDFGYSCSRRLYFWGRRNLWYTSCRNRRDYPLRSLYPMQQDRISLRSAPSRNARLPVQTPPRSTGKGKQG